MNTLRNRTLSFQPGSSRVDADPRRLVRTISAAVDCSSFILHRSSFMKRTVIIVCDSMGVGELPDAKDFGDEGSNTLGHVLESQHPKLPNLTRLGLLHTLPTPASSDNPQAAFG